MSQKDDFICAGVSVSYESAKAVQQKGIQKNVIFLG